MDGPSELSLFEIRKFILENGCKVTNHALVKHFKQFLTNPDSQNEARKQFKTYVNILATIKNDDNQKYLLLRKKYLHECPSEDIVNRTDVPPSPGNSSINSDGFASPFRQPPPYKPPPEVSPTVGKLTRMASETKENYRDCVNEFAAAVRKIDPNRMQDEVSDSNQINISTPNESVPSLPPRNRSSVGQLSLSRENSIENDNKENVKSNTEGLVTTPLAPPDNSNENTEKNRENCASDVENPISVKEATRKFNRMASEEEARIISPPGKKKQEKPVVEDRMSQEVTFAHPKAKEWIVSSAKANYQELAKLAQDYPELVKLQDPTTGYTALHWACKHGNEDVVKLIAGTYKAEVNARTNGGYTPLHLAMQFGRDNIFELLCNVYKANRDAMDWSGNKPLDYRKQHTTVSASTYSKIKARRKHSEKDLGFLRIGSLNVRVKKTTEAFSNFLGVGGGSTTAHSNQTIGQSASLPHHHRHHQYAGMMRNSQMMTTGPGAAAQLRSRASVPMNPTQFDKIHKSWGSADNIQQHSTGSDGMPPPKGDSIKKRKTKKHSTGYDTPPSGGYSSMPTTPNQLRAPIGILAEHPGDFGDSDSDSACGFGSNWSVGARASSSLDHSSNRSSAPNYI